MGIGEAALEGELALGCRGGPAHHHDEACGRERQVSERGRDQRHGDKREIRSASLEPRREVCLNPLDRERDAGSAVPPIVLPQCQFSAAFEEQGGWKSHKINPHTALDSRRGAPFVACLPWCGECTCCLLYTSDAADE